jgi:hypothetical protein
LSARIVEIAETIRLQKFKAILVSLYLERDACDKAMNFGNGE